MTDVIKISVENTKDEAYAHAERLKQQGYSVTVELTETVVIEANGSVFNKDGGAFVIVGKR